MAPHSSTLAWKIPWTEEPGRLQSMGSQRIRHVHCTPTFSRTQAPQLTWQHMRSVRLALTCLEMMSFPRGMGAPFSVAILFKVAMAFSWFPDSTSYLALSGSHCGDRRPRCGRLQQNTTLGPNHTRPRGCSGLGEPRPALPSF